MALVDFPKEIFNTGKDMLLLTEGNAVIESIKNYIETEILDIPLSLNTSIGAKQMLLKAQSSPEVRYIIKRIKNIIEENIKEVKTCNVTYKDSGTSKTISLSLVLQAINGADKLPVNIVIRI